MEKLNRVWGVLAALALVACTSAPPPPVPTPVVPDVEVEPGVVLAPRWRDSPLIPVEPEVSSPTEQTSSLDLSNWPFGWVFEDDSTRSLGLAPRFWSDQKPRWKIALDVVTPLPQKVLQLERIHRSGSAEEALRASWLLFQAYSLASLRDQARGWLDLVHQAHPTPTTTLERAWDQAFRLQDLTGARALWAPTRELTVEQQRKALLLRQKLFGGSLSLASVEADDFLSTAVLDRDDLWGATWNGAVVRWSLVTNQLDLVLPAGPTVSPIKLLVATGWFVYAFQDQSLLRYSKVTGTWRSFPYPPGWVGLRVQAAVAEGEESLWVAHLGQGLWRWSQGQWSLVDADGGGPFLNALSADGQGGFLVGSKDKGLWRWNAGLWSSLVPEEGAAPVNVSVIQPNQTGDRWLIGTWGEGTWVFAHGTLSAWSDEPDYVTAAAWEGEEPLWGALDRGIVQGRGAQRQVLGAREGVSGGVSSLVTWEGRWIWGTTGQGWGWWSEHENSALLR